MSIVRHIDQPACRRQDPALSLSPDLQLQTGLHPCPGCEVLTGRPRYCNRCQDEIDSLRAWQLLHSRPLRTPLLRRPNWKDYLVHTAALLALASFFWLCCAL